MSLEHSPARQKRKASAQKSSGDAAPLIPDANAPIDAVIPVQALTVDEFCRAHRMSRAQLYEDWAQKRGPRFYYNGNRRRITPEAAADWRREREAEAS